MNYLIREIEQLYRHSRNQSKQIRKLQALYNTVKGDLRAKQRELVECTLYDRQVEVTTEMDDGGLVTKIILDNPPVGGL